MPEISKISLEAPNIKSKDGVIMQPVVPKDFRLQDLPDSHRVYRSPEDERLYIKRGGNFTGYGSFEAANRAFVHIVEREASTNLRRQILLETQQNNQAALVALKQRFDDINAKYNVLGQQFKSLREERRSLELARVDLQQLALEATTIHNLRQDVLIRVEKLSSSAGLLSTPIVEDDQLSNHIAVLLSEVHNRLAEVPLPAHPGWILVPYEVY